MSKDTWKVTDEEINRAYDGLLLQVHVHGLDLNDINLLKFLKHQAEVLALLEAQCRFYSFQLAPK